MKLTPQPWGEAHEWLESPSGEAWTRRTFKMVYDSFWCAGRRGVFWFFFSMKRTGTDGSWRSPWTHPSWEEFIHSDYPETFHLGDDVEEIASLPSPA